MGITGRIQTRNYENQQGQRVYVTEVVADSFQLLESRANREGQAGGGYASAGGFAGNAAPSFGGSEPSKREHQTLDVMTIHSELIQWTSRMTIYHSKNGFNELKL